MINEKMKKLGTNRSTIRELFEYGRMLKDRIGEENVFDYSLGNPSVEPPSSVTDGLIDLLNTKNPTALHGYTSAAGDISVRQAIASFIKDSFGAMADASNIYLTAGAAGALTSVLCGITTPGEKVIVLAPYFPEYRVFIENSGAEMLPVPCRSSDFGPDIGLLEAAIDDKCTAIIINSPNNPTGAVYSKEDIIAIADVLERKSREFGKPIYIIADEPYRELLYDGAEAPYIPNYYNNTIVCYSYSKSLSIPGDRIGYVFVSPLAECAEDVYAAVMGAGRALGFVCAPSLLQKLIPYCLGSSSDIRIYEKNRRMLLDALCEYGYKIVPPKGAFYLFVKSPIPDAKAFSDIAKGFGLLLVPSDDFGIPGYVRIAYCQSPDMIKRSLPKFGELMDYIKQGKEG